MNTGEGQVVENLDVHQYSSSRLLSTSIGLIAVQFFLLRLAKRFRRGVVQTIYLPTHALDRPVILQPGSTCMAAVLRTSI